MRLLCSCIKKAAFSSSWKNFGAVEIVSKGINWALLPFVSMFVPAAQYGSATFVYSLIVAASVVFIFGQNRTILRYYSEDNKESLAGALCFFVFLFPLMCLLGFLVEVKGAGLITLAGAGVALNTLLSMVFRVEKNSSWFFAIRFGYVFGRFLICAVVFIWSKDFEWYLLSEALWSVIPLLLAGRKFAGLFNAMRSFSVSRLLGVAKLGAPIFIQSLALAIVAVADKFFLKKYSGLSDLGSYSLAYSVASAATFITAYFAMNYEVIIYRASDFGAAKAVGRKFLRGVGAGFVVMFPVFLMLYYGMAAKNQSMKFDILSFVLIYSGFFALAAYYYSSYLISYLELTRLLPVSAVLYAFVAVVLDWLLVPLFGGRGAAFAYFISGVALFGLTWVLSFSAGAKKV